MRLTCIGCYNPFKSEGPLVVVFFFRVISAKCILDNLVERYYIVSS